MAASASLASLLRSLWRQDPRKCFGEVCGRARGVGPNLSKIGTPGNL